MGTKTDIPIIDSNLNIQMEIIAASINSQNETIEQFFENVLITFSSGKILGLERHFQNFTRSFSKILDIVF